MLITGINAVKPFHCGSNKCYPFAGLSAVYGDTFNKLYALFKGAPFESFLNNFNCILYCQSWHIIFTSLHKTLTKLLSCWLRYDSFFQQRANWCSRSRDKAIPKTKIIKFIFKTICKSLVYSFPKSCLKSFFQEMYIKFQRLLLGWKSSLHSLYATKVR